MNFLEEKQRYGVPPDKYLKICEQIKNDSEFLKKCNIIDYSLLFAVHDKSTADEINLPDYKDFNQNKTTIMGNDKDEPSWGNFGKQLLSPVTTSDGKYILYFGIIDIFTRFGPRKKLEYVTRRIIQGSGISCVPPGSYSERFIDFMVNKVLEAKQNEAARTQLAHIFAKRKKTTEQKAIEILRSAPQGSHNNL